MKHRTCLNCKWFKAFPPDAYKLLCLNPLNDTPYDHFNQSTGNTVSNIRVAMAANPGGVCEHHERKK